MSDVVRSTPSEVDTRATRDHRLRTLLPTRYQDVYEDLLPVPMGTAGLKYGPDGLVAWGEIWGSFCDLAMAGGPPHRGTLLEPGLPGEVAAQPEAYALVVEELCRGLMLVTGLPARPSPAPGWVTLICLSEAMAGWLVRAITMENISARSAGVMLDLPAGPGFRLEKEIRNVVTSVAKTCHYWHGHIPRAQRQSIADLLAAMARESPLLAPAFVADGLPAEAHARAAAAAAETIQRRTGLDARPQATGWLGVECGSVRTAVGMMRALVTVNALSRREGTRLCVPVHPLRDPQGDALAAALARVADSAH